MSCGSNKEGTVFPKVLVVSNECFSKTSSNGRTLGAFFVGWPKTSLAQFFISGNPDYNYCESYYRVSDKQVIKSIVSRHNVGGPLLESDNNISVNVNHGQIRKKKRNALTMLLRNLAWTKGNWRNIEFEKWVKTFNPDIILLQAGDCPFMFEIALGLSKKYNAKFIIYNSEGYYFKNYDYFRSKGIAHLIYPMFIRKLRNSIEKAYANADYVICNCEQLQDDFAKILNTKSRVIYTSATVENFLDADSDHGGFITTYCGNVGIGRHRSLIDIAEILQSISGNLYVDVYGKVPDEIALAELKSCKGIRYHGIVSYERVNEVLRSSDLLLHVESFEDFYREDIKYGFSTKIADSLSIGKCFLIYAPSNLACYKYLNNNNAAFTVSNKVELEKTLKLIIADSTFRKKYINKAQELSLKNHNLSTNVQVFRQTLIGLFS